MILPEPETREISIAWLVPVAPVYTRFLNRFISANKGNNKITELRTILQRESQNS